MAKILVCFLVIPIAALGLFKWLIFSLIHRLHVVEISICSIRFK